MLKSKVSERHGTPRAAFPTKQAVERPETYRFARSQALQSRIVIACGGIPAVQRHGTPMVTPYGTGIRLFDRIRAAFGGPYILLLDHFINKKCQRAAWNAEGGVPYKASRRAT